VSVLQYEYQPIGEYPYLWLVVVPRKMFDLQVADISKVSLDRVGFWFVVHTVGRT
jgi:hypothetical protein